MKIEIVCTSCLMFMCVVIEFQFHVCKRKDIFKKTFFQQNFLNSQTILIPVLNTSHTTCRPWGICILLWWPRTNQKGAYCIYEECRYICHSGLCWELLWQQCNIRSERVRGVSVWGRDVGVRRLLLLDKELQQWRERTVRGFPRHRE